jgi:hypothetical protein
MNIQVFLDAAVLFALIFLVHVIYWRSIKPKDQITPLLAIFAAVPLIPVAVCCIIDPRLIHQADLWLSLILYYAAAGVYIQTYPSIQANCPSLYIVNYIGRKKKGAAIKDIQKAVEKKRLTGLSERVKDLVSDGFIRTISGKKIDLTNKGKALAMLFIIYRTGLLGLEEGKG